MTDAQNGKKKILVRTGAGAESLSGGGWEVDAAGWLRILDKPPTSTGCEMVAAYGAGHWTSVAFAEAIAETPGS